MGSETIVVALLRGVHVAALVSLFGSLLFLAVVAPPATAEHAEGPMRMQSRVLRVIRASAACALLGGHAHRR
jgi:hypothetical protein